MKHELASVYRCPSTRETLSLRDAVLTGDEVVSGKLVSPSGETFVIENGLPNLIWPLALADADRAARELYEGRAHVYDQFLPLTFSTFREDEGAVRRQMVDLLNLS